MDYRTQKQTRNGTILPECFQSPNTWPMNHKNELEMGKFSHYAFRVHGLQNTNTSQKSAYEDRVLITTFIFAPVAFSLAHYHYLFYPIAEHRIQLLHMRITSNKKKIVLTERKSTSRMTKWRDMERAMAPISHMLLHGGILVRDWFSLKLFTVAATAREERETYTSDTLPADTARKAT